MAIQHSIQSGRYSNVIAFQALFSGFISTISVFMILHDGIAGPSSKEKCFNQLILIGTQLLAVSRISMSIKYVIFQNINKKLCNVKPSNIKRIHIAQKVHISIK